ncbi:MAG: MlaD family protein [Verrucomicrobiota bacterium]|nr:MlaD family protein [Verrucomicrobiota bacterium]
MKENRTELFVGFFLLIGLLLLGFLVLKFGNFGDRFEETYSLTVTFDDGGGLIKGTDVRLGGVKIGRLAESPTVNLDNYGGAIVSLDIYDDFQIPEGAKFSIGTSGLLGDAMIEIEVPDNRTGKFITPDSKIKGERITGLGALASSAESLSNKGQVVLEDVRSALGDIGSAVEKLDQSILREENLQSFNHAVAELADALDAINNKVLGDDNTDNLRELLVNMKKASVKVDAAAEKIGPILDNGSETISAIEPGLQKLTAAAEGADKAFEKINNGSGILNSILKDEELKKDFKGFIANLRRNGILFYKDNSIRNSEPLNSRRKGSFSPR